MNDCNSNFSESIFLFRLGSVVSLHGIKNCFLNKNRLAKTNDGK